MLMTYVRLHPRSSAMVAEAEQSRIIHDFSTDNDLKLNSEKTEIVKLSRSNSHEKKTVGELNSLCN